MGSLGISLHRDCYAMINFAKISPHIPSTCSQNAIIFSLIIHIIPNRQNYVAIDNPSLVPSVSWLPTTSNPWNYVNAADDVSQGENVQIHGCRCVSQLYKCRDWIGVTRVFRYCGVRQRYRLFNESSILILELDIELLLQLPQKTPIQHAITPSWTLLYPHPVVQSIPSVQALAFCAMTHLSYAFTF
jgi:hypothetical protein